MAQILRILPLIKYKNAPRALRRLAVSLCLRAILRSFSIDRSRKISIHSLFSICCRKSSRNRWHAIYVEWNAVVHDRRVYLVDIRRHQYRTSVNLQTDLRLGTRRTALKNLRNFLKSSVRNKFDTSIDKSDLEPVIILWNQSSKNRQKMRRPTERNVLHVLLILSTATLARCALLEMSRVLWNRTVSGGLTKVGKLDPLRVPVIKVDQSEGDTSYRIILRNLEIIGLNESTLESIHVARGALKSNLSELETGYVSYSDLRDVDSVRYQFHTMTREPSAPREREGSEAVVSPVNRATDIRPTSRYQEGRFDRLQDQYGSRIFDQNRQYDRQIPFRSDATSNGFYRGNLRASSEDEAGNFGKRPTYVQSAYAQRGRNFRGHQGSSYSEDVDCEDTADSKFARYQKNSRQYKQRQSAGNGQGENVEVRLQFNYNKFKSIVFHTI